MRSVLGPSMSGIITSRRMASGSAERASSAPAAPPFAPITIQFSVSSRLRRATSWMSFSSSMIRICLGGILRIPFGRQRAEEANDVPFEIGGTAAALGQELRCAEAEAGLIGAAEVARRIDEKRHAAEIGAPAETLDDREAVDVGQAEVEHDEGWLVAFAEPHGCGAAGRVA